VSAWGSGGARTSWPECGLAERRRHRKLDRHDSGFGVRRACPGPAKTWHVLTGRRHAPAGRVGFGPVSMPSVTRRLRIRRLGFESLRAHQTCKAVTSGNAGGGPLLSHFQRPVSRPLDRGALMVLRRSSGPVLTSAFTSSTARMADDLTVSKCGATVRANRPPGGRHRGEGFAGRASRCGSVAGSSAGREARRVALLGRRPMWRTLVLSPWCGDRR
jgi:hypothetical protein